MTKVCIHQPDFLPFLGFYQKLKRSDIYIALDHVQFIKRGWQNRDRIKSQNGEIWLTVPVENKGNYKQLLMDTKLDDSQQWREKHLNTIKSCYGKAPHFKSYFEKIEAIYRQPHGTLTKLNLSFIRFFLDIFKMDIPIKKSSEMNPDGAKNELLIDLCKKISAAKYITGTGATEYLDDAMFKANGIELEVVSFNPKPYPQLFGDFIPNLSAVDFLFNKGVDGLDGYLN